MIRKSKISSMAKMSVKKKKDPFKTSFKEKLAKLGDLKSLGALANTFFGDYVDKNPKNFESLKADLNKSGMSLLSRTYFSELIFIPLAVYALFLIFFTVLFFIPGPPLVFKAILIALGPFTMAIVTFSLLYLYPSMRVRSRSLSIEMNLPFALNHMSAVTGSGIPPAALFELLTNFEEYGELSREANQILKRVKIFGEDLITSMKNVAKKTPSDEFKEILYGIISTLESGGSLKKFLQERGKTALFNYKIRRKKYIQTLSVYASVYTAVLVAAPLFMIAILALLNLMGGSVLGVEIKSILNAGIYVVIPLINAMFILFLVWMQKEM